MLIIVAWLLTKSFDEAGVFQDLGKLGQNLCINFVPLGPFHQLDISLLCGTAVASGAIKQALLDTGLIHLMVVSGSHLAFLEVFLVLLPLWTQRIILGVYCFLVGFQPPVMRAFIRRLISNPLHRLTGMTSLQIEAATVVLIAGAYPVWLTSRSFLMSWMCGLALSTPTPSRGPAPFWIAMKCYVFLLPFCWAAPITVLWNTLFAPVVGLVLFPCRLITVVLPWMSVITDLLWNLFCYVITNGPQGTQYDLFIPTTWLMFIPITLHLALLIWEVKWRRELAFSY